MPQNKFKPHCKWNQCKSYNMAVENYGAWGPGVLRTFLQVATPLDNHGNPPQVQGSSRACYWLQLTLDQLWSAPIFKHRFKKRYCLSSCFVSVLHLCICCQLIYVHVYINCYFYVSNKMIIIHITHRIPINSKYQQTRFVCTISSLNGKGFVGMYI